MGNPALAAEHVTCTVEGHVLLDDVTLEVRAGEVVAVAGPNGAGKTTLLRVLGGILRPQAGSVHLAGRPLAACSRTAIARMVATVPQHTDLDFDLTAIELVLMGRHPHLGRFRLEGQEDLAIAREALRATGADVLEGRSLLTLSGGERQRVLIARALAQQARVLVLDEPTASLDLAHRIQVEDLIQRLAVEKGLAVVVALHDLAVAAHCAHRLVLLSHGRVLAQGAMHDVLTPSYIEQAYGVSWGTGGSPLPEAPLEDLSPEGRAAKRAEQAAVRAHPDRRAKGLVIVNTGSGKGKTTAALGLLLRAWGRDMRVVMLQFIKAKTGNWGESRAARKMGVEIIPLGDGFTWTSRDIQRDRALAREGWEQCRERIQSGAFDIVIMDELTYCLKFGWLDLDEVIEVLNTRPEGQHVVITGRDAPQELIDFADLVTEMREVKHPYRSGVRAQPGIEF